MCKKRQQKSTVNPYNKIPNKVNSKMDHATIETKTKMCSLIRMQKKEYIVTGKKWGKLIPQHTDFGSVYWPPNLRVVDVWEADDVEGLEVSRYVPLMIANSMSCRFFKSSSPSGWKKATTIMNYKPNNTIQQNNAGTLTS